MRSGLLQALAVAATVLGLAALPTTGVAAAQQAAGCTGEHWVDAFEAPPTDATVPADAQNRIFLGGPDQTYRDIITPHLGGTRVRVRLSNRFGSAAITFPATRIAHRTAGATIDPATSTAVTFGGGAPSVTIPAGQDVVSDPVDFPFKSFDDLAISVYASAPGLIPTHHFTSRQTSYATAPLAGDHTADARGGAFTQASTLRWFVVGLDVLAPAATRTVVAFGDSLTDGFQGPPLLIPENTLTVDQNKRYPDYLQHRIDAAGLPLVVANAGISGSRVLDDGLIPAFGPRALARLQADVIDQANVSDVIVFHGINDVGQGPTLTAAQLEAGYTALIARLHDAGLHVLQATLTPAGSNPQPTYSDASARATRAAVNTWIRTQSPADAVLDFDAAVRDPGDPEVIAPPYDGGDGLHFSAAGYQRIADAVDLGLLRGSGCATGGAPTCPATKRVRVSLTSAERRGLRRATVTVEGRRVATLRPGRTSVRLRLRSSTGVVTVRLRIQRRGRADAVRVIRVRLCRTG